MFVIEVFETSGLLELGIGKQPFEPEIITVGFFILDDQAQELRGLNKQTILELSSQDWIAHHRNVLLTGPTGVGKSYIACALGNFAARQGHTVLYLRAPRLFETLLQSKADGSHLKTLTKLAKTDILILDDLFLTALSDAERKDLLEIIEDRHHKAPTVITSQCPTKDWHHIIGEPTIADAICDRLLHHSYKIELKGESIRKNKK